MGQEAEIRLTADARKAISEVRQLERQMHTTAQSMQQDMQNVQKVSKMAGVALLGIGTAGAAVVTKSTLLAARVETLGIVLQTVGRNAGYTEAQLKHFEERTISMGITTQAARVSLTRLAQAEIDLARGAELARIAQDAAVIAGINSSEAFERMIVGIQTLNPRILRTLGLTINLEQEYSKFAAIQGVVVSEITAQQKKQIALNAVVEAGVRIQGSYEAAMETAGKKALSLARHFEEASKIIGEQFLGAYTILIDKTTELLTWFRDLDEDTQALIATFLGVGSAIALVGGAVLLVLPQLVTLIGLASSVGASFLMTGASATIMGEGMWLAAAGAGGLGTALTGLAAITGVGLLLAGLAVGLTFLAKKMSDANAETEALKDAVGKEEQVLRKSASTYKAYLEGVKEEAAAKGLAVTVNGQYVEGTLAAARSGYHLRGSVEAVNESVWKASQGFEYETKLLQQRTDLYLAQQRAMDPHVLLQQEQEERTAALNKQMSDMAFIMQNEVGPSMEEHNERLRELNSEAGGVRSRIMELEELEYLTEKQAAELEELHGQLRNITDQIAEENAMWEKNAAMILFNFAQRALADAPLRAQAQILGTMATDMGLMDETSAAIWQDMAGAIEEGLASGVYDDLFAFIDGMYQRLTNWPSYLQTTIEVETVGGGQYAPGSTGGTQQWVAKETAYTSSAGGLDFGAGYAMGGLFGGGGDDRIIEVGEGGSELLVPIRGGGYMVVPNQLTRRLKAQGINAGRKMQGGGDLFEQEYYGYTPPGRPTRSFDLLSTHQSLYSRMKEAAGGGRRSSPAGTVRQAVQEVAGTVTQASSAAIEAAVAPVTVQLQAQTQMSNRQAAEIARSNREMIGKMDELIEAVRLSATNEGVSEGMSTAMQFFEG